MAGIEDDVRTHVLSGQKFHWVGLLAPPNDALADLAATTDLFLVGHQTPRRMRRTRSLDVGELVVSTARPVLIAGAGVDAVRAERIVVGWKNTRETRRAVADALPLMARATAVAFVAIDDGAPEADSGLADAVGWAKSHGIKAGSRLLPADGDTARALKEAVSDFGGDLLVTGAYGHTRAREWLFGGVTRALLETTDINLLMSN
jgi:nucleotide-binding universal stress UspA family protein